MSRRNKSRKDIFAIDNDYFHLKIADLLEARELYHVHFMHKKNVVATAIGRYRVRKGDDWPDKKGEYSVGRLTGVKTLENTEVRFYSWPCLLVFVENWIPAGQFEKKPGKPRSVSEDDWIPPWVYMPDGRKVPVCVVQAPRARPGPASVGNCVFPSNAIGGGFPVLVNVQEKERLASIGCLVTDGHHMYGLTNRHVCGEPGDVIYSVLGGNKVRVGKSASRQVSRELFTTLYPVWQGKDVYVNLDVGLIEIDNVNLWTSQVYGIGKFNTMEDLSCENMSLKLIGAPVRAYGCVSRQMRGEIQAMFYRYKSAGGFEYVADFLIGARTDAKGEFQTHHGDSGTVWFLDTDDDRRLTPIAIQWGGQAFAGNGQDIPKSYALATCLSTVCNRLGVDIVADWAVDLPEYWGAVGHYSIAALALGAIRDGKLKKLMEKNLSCISFQIEELSSKTGAGLSKEAFVPLADVPDLVWKMGPYRRPKAYESPNHFADMDKPEPGTKKTLLDICEDKSKINVKEWQRYYEATHDEGRGILPFRIWQIYAEMVKFLHNKQKDRFVCAAGILSHYVADACQPLHISYRYDGDPDDAASKGVHSAFDKAMVEYSTDEIKEALPGLIAAKAKKMPTPVTGGRCAAEVTVDLMRRTLTSINPKKACEAYVRYADFKPKKRSAELWKEFGTKMQDVMADGAVTLAHLWESAWTEGKGNDAFNVKDLVAVKEEKLAKIYQGKDFLPSYNINGIKNKLH